MRLNFNKAVIPLFLAAPLAASPVTRAQYLMGTVCEITAHGPRASDAIGAAFREIARWEEVLTLYGDDSEASRLARTGLAPFVASREMRRAVELSLRYSRESGGAFDPTVWALRSGGAGLPAVGFGKIELLPGGVIRFKTAGMGLDFGGIGKGLALDEAARVLRERGVEAALLNFGGQIYALGAPPGLPGWEVAVPGLSGGLIVKDASVSTSGDEEKPGHILDPRTGRPVHAAAVTVAAPTGAGADAWSTALYVLAKPPASFPHCAIVSGRPISGACRAYQPNQGGRS